MRQRQQIFGAMVGLTGKQINLLLAAFLLGDVAGDLRGADDLSRLIGDRRDA